MSTVDRNPYAPPQAEVGEVVQPEGRGPRPVQVTWAVNLFWVDLALSVVYDVASWQRSESALSQIGAAGFALMLLALEAFIIVKIARGRNWARWVAFVSVILGIFGILGTVGVLPFALGTPVNTSRFLALGVTSTLLDIAALYLLFVSPGRYWFKRSLESA